jgi:hypothetical protein
MIRLYREVDIAREIGRSRQRVWQLVQSLDLIPAALAGSMVLYDEAALETLRQAGKGICQACGTEFHPGGRWKYCSPECSRSVERKLRAGYARKRYAKRKEAKRGETADLCP